MFLIINPPLAIYNHLAALSFMLAGVFADLLVVRLCLVSAYLFLLINGLLGSPLWPHLYRPHHLTVDMLIWGVVCFYVHMASVVRLLSDERHVPLTDEQAALWRMFYRVGGMSRKLFVHHIAAHMQVITVDSGQVLPVDDYFYITLRGTVEIQIFQHGQQLKTAVDGSGCMFDFKSLGLLQPVTSPMAQHTIKVTTRSSCTLFRFSNADIRTIANVKATKSVWQTVFIGILARIAVQRLGDGQGQDETATTIMDVSNRTDPDYLDPLFLPLGPSERPNPLAAGSGQALERPLAHIWFCLQRSFSPPWPFGKHLIGLRHHMLSAPVPVQGATETLERSIQRADEHESLLLTAQRHVGTSHHAPTKYRAFV